MRYQRDINERLMRDQREIKRDQREWEMHEKRMRD